MIILQAYAISQLFVLSHPPSEYSSQIVENTTTYLPS